MASARNNRPSLDDIRAMPVGERKYTSWPAAIRDAFAAARTVRTAKPTFRLTIKSEGAR